MAMQAFYCFWHALCFAPSFCVGKVFSVCRKRAQTPAQPTNEYLFFFIFGKSGAIGFFILFVLGKISLHNIYF